MAAASAAPPLVAPKAVVAAQSAMVNEPEPTRSFFLIVIDKDRGVFSI